MSDFKEQQKKDRIGHSSTSASTPQRIGTPAPPKGLQLEQQSQDAAISWKTTNIHKVLTDAYKGDGGCKCTAKSNPDGTRNTTYLQPNRSELQFEDRVEASEYPNLFSGSVKAKVEPIFTGGTIETKIIKNGKVEAPLPISTHGFNKFLKRCDGVSKRYDVAQAEIAKWLEVNGVVYPIIGKRDDGVIVLTYRRAIDVLFEPLADDETYELKRIMFFDRSKTVDDVTTHYATIHEMMGGVYVKKRMKTDSKSAWETDIDVWEEEEVIMTTSDRMLVLPLLEKGHPTGCYLPKIPASYDVVRLCLLLMNMLSTALWAQKMDGFPILAIWGDVESLNRNIGSHLNIPVSVDGKAAPAPVKVESNPETLRVALEFIDKVVGWIKTAMKQYGVTITESDTAQAQTAESKSYDYEASNQALRNTIVSTLEPLDEWVITHHMYLTTSSEDEWELQRSYPQDFFPKPEEKLEELLAALDSTLDKGLLDLAEVVATKILGSLCGDVSPEKLEEIIENSRQAIQGYQSDDGDNKGGKEGGK